MSHGRCATVLFFVLCFVAADNCAAQDVPLPPRPRASGNASASASTSHPSMEGKAKVLQDEISAIGRVSWTQTSRNTKTNEASAPVEAWEEVSRVTISPGNCEMRAAWKSSGQAENGSTYFFEEFDKVEVMPSETHESQTHPGTQYTMTPAPYSVVINFGTDFKVRDLQTANRIASEFREIAQQCKAPSKIGNSAPSLEETLGFIEDRLNLLGNVTWLSTVKNSVAGTSGSPTKIAFQYSHAVGDARACRVSYHYQKFVADKSVFEGDAILSLRRVEKLSVMSLQDANRDLHAREGHPELMEEISPDISDLLVTGAAGRGWFVPFPDQDSANRVAKAMLHAVELCGGGKEPF